jgi:hypothetical protein
MQESRRELGSATIFDMRKPCLISSQICIVLHTNQNNDVLPPERGVVILGRRQNPPAWLNNEEHLSQSRTVIDSLLAFIGESRRPAPLSITQAIENCRNYHLRLLLLPFRYTTNSSIPG